MTEETGRAEGLFESLRNLAKTFLAVVQTRIEIFASEIDEERARLARIAVLAAVQVPVRDPRRAAQGPDETRGAMSALPQILERRARLLAEAEVQRRALSEGIAVCRNVLVVVDRGIVWASWLRARPYLVVAAATAIAALRPRLALEWSARLLTLWRVGSLLYDAVKPAHGDRAKPYPPGSQG